MATTSATNSTWWLTRHGRSSPRNTANWKLSIWCDLLTRWMTHSLRFRPWSIWYSGRKPSPRELGRWQYSQLLYFCGQNGNDLLLDLVWRKRLTDVAARATG